MAQEQQLDSPSLSTAVFCSDIGVFEGVEGIPLDSDQLESIDGGVRWFSVVQGAGEMIGGIIAIVGGALAMDVPEPTGGSKLAGGLMIAGGFISMSHGYLEICDELTDGGLAEVMGRGSNRWDR